MKKNILTAGVVLLSQLLVAQDLDKALERANERYDKYNALLNFSAEQSEKVKSLLVGIEQKQEYVQFDGNYSDEQKKEVTAKNEEVFETIFVGFLTDEQKEKYKKAK